jgi:hypothetical protein
VALDLKGYEIKNEATQDSKKGGEEDRPSTAGQSLGKVTIFVTHTDKHLQVLCAPDAARG